ncbi:hypothetical protein, partial [Roseburia sp. 1XD42-69]|uniref:hypothetical protein n=1 Tax=Roseburia sp. 1XD42-69 TaxID=2320088 RepID=UPI001A9BC924
CHAPHDAEKMYSFANRHSVSLLVRMFISSIAYMLRESQTQMKQKSLIFSCKPIDNNKNV